MKASSFIDELLAEQQQLTAVERFAQRQERQRDSGSQYYQDLIPLDRPRPGEQYAFRVDLDLCTGCKACVSACHSLNGLDENETWRTVGLLHGGSPEKPYQQTVTTACHHCADPACLNGCPVLAYEKDEATGIVRHLDDQCIGCQYCVLKCPYDVPKYSSARGIVRKCDMCHSRLSVGEAPACVQACPSGAISIQLVNRETIDRVCAGPEERLLPGVFPSNYTKPTTTYISSKPFPEHCEPVNSVIPRLEPAHWPLVWMLALTQAAAGLFLAASFAAVLWPQLFSVARVPLVVSGVGLLVTGLGASVLHLGRPLGAWRSLLGLRRSWMSREILAFLLLGLASAGSLWTAMIRPADVPTWWTHVAALLGLSSVFCSAMIYTDTRRPAWAWQLTFPKFFGTTLLLGAAGAGSILNWLAFLSATAAPQKVACSLAWVAAVVRTALFVWEAQKFTGALGISTFGPAIKRLAIAQIALFVFSTLFGVAAVFNNGLPAACLATLSFLLTFSSRVVERYCFFVTASAARMPGSLSP